jgi:hypothetical protein
MVADKKYLLNTKHLCVCQSLDANDGVYSSGISLVITEGHKVP